MRSHHSFGAARVSLELFPGNVAHGVGAKVMPGIGAATCPTIENDDKAGDGQAHVQPQEDSSSIVHEVRELLGFGLDFEKG